MPLPPDFAKLAAALAFAINLRRALDELAEEGHDIPAQISASVDQEICDVELAISRARAGLLLPSQNMAEDADADGKKSRSGGKRRARRRVARRSE